MKTPQIIPQKGKGGRQESVDFRRDVPLHTGGDPFNRRADKYGKREELSKETLRDILDI